MNFIFDLLLRELNYKKFIILFIFFSLLFLLIVGLINIIVDPYGMYNYFTYFDKKPQISIYTRLHKTQKIYSNSYECIFTGTSRVEGLFDFDFFETNHPFFKICKTYYNAGISSASAEEISEFIKMIVNKKSVNKIFYGLDFIQFSSPIIESKRSFLSYYRRPFYFRIVIPISIETLRDSIKTIRAEEGTFYKENGSWNIDKEMESKNKKVFSNKSILTLKQLFLLNEKVYYDSYYNNFSLNLKDKSSTLKYYQTILELAYRNQIELFLFINPFHVRLLEVLDKKIGYHQFEDWKRKIVFINENLAKKYNKKPFLLFDFSGYNRFTSEEIPSEGFRMKYFYYEDSHLRAELGNLMLKRILGDSFEDFGFKLTSENIEYYLKEQKMKRQIWREKNQEEVNEILRFIQQKL